MWTTTLGVINLLGSLWALLLSLIATLVSIASGLVSATLSVTSLVGGVLVVAGLLVVAAVLNLLGVEDVHETLSGVVGAESSDEDLFSLAELEDLDEEDVTDQHGRFASGTFHRVTGLAVPEFIVLFVQAKGGRVWQSTLNTCLPWSRATVTRYLDRLEANGTLVRVERGNRNLVCTPETVPDD